MPHQNLDAVCATVLERSAIVTTTLLMLLLTIFATGARAASVETIDDTFPASITPAGEYADNGTGETPSISADGRYVAFQSNATNVGDHGSPGVNEAYITDLDTGEVKLASRSSGVDGEPANEPGETTGVENVMVSGDGRYVIFSSRATNIVTGLPSAEPEEHPRHVYRRDLQTGETVLVDRVTGPLGAILDERKAQAEAVSEEGRYVVFRDRVDDLENPAGEHAQSSGYTVYVRDMQTGATTAVSRASGVEGQLADETSRAGSISPEGRYVAFESAATNLVPGMGANTFSQVYLRNLRTDRTTLLSRTAPNGEPGSGESGEPVLAGNDGCEVAFESAATNLYPAAKTSTPQIYLTDLCSKPASTTLVSRADGPEGAPLGEGGEVPVPLGASADGRYILFAATLQAHGMGTAAKKHLYLRDLDAGHTTLIDRARGPEGEVANQQPEAGAISTNACRVAFATRATNLAAQAPPLSDPFETYIRQLAGCQPPVEEHHEQARETGKGGEQPNTSGQPNGTTATTTPAQPTSGHNDACVVPAMRGLKLAAIKRALHAAHCRLGRIAHHYSAIHKGGLVEQSLHQGTIRPAGTKVNLWLSEGDHRTRPASRPASSKCHSAVRKPCKVVRIDFGWLHWRVAPAKADY
jgi:WD40-like Beta Propeller Repeat